jgi:hypothetical protein
MRSEQEIFDELEDICKSPGYAHVIAVLCFRDNFVGYSEELTTKHLEKMFSPDRLIRTELSTLIGLMLKGDVNLSLPLAAELQNFVERTEKLLLELHNSMTANWSIGLTPETLTAGIDPFATGNALREPIFYGGESAYISQYRDLAAQKYKPDDAWLEANKGFSIEAARDVVQLISEYQEKKLFDTLEAIRGTAPETWTLLPGFTFTAQDLASRSRIDLALIKRVLAAFSVPADEKNKTFRSLHEFNIANSLPLLRLDDGSFVLFQSYSLAEALYETPFYWMGADKTYVTQAMQHRGQFTENFARKRLERVFGKEHVYANIDIFESKGKKAGEIDVLVVFGNRLIILQAKSKRLTLEARKGNDGQIKSDFKKSIQDSYDQGFSCAKFLDDPKYKLLTADSKEIVLSEGIREIYVLCVVSDHYPALSFQARQFLKIQTSDKILPPFVMDLFALDAMTEMLESPLRLLSYVNRRVKYSDRVMASHELTILSYHLKKNLWFEDDTDMVMLGDDISADLDIAMAVRRDGIPGKRTPDGILTRLDSTSLGRIIREIETKPNPTNLDLGFMLLSLSEDAIKDLSDGVDKIGALARTDQKNHDITFTVKDVGLTIHCNGLPMEVAQATLENHCAHRKYAQRSNLWFGLCIRPEDASIRFGINFDYAWQQNSEMDAATKDMRKPSTLTELKKFAKMRRKIGRNEPCPCGSGKKFKKCHGQP